MGQTYRTHRWVRKSKSQSRCQHCGHVERTMSIGSWKDGVESDACRSAYKIDQASAAPQRREPIRPATVSYRPNRVVYHGRPSPRRCADCGSVETKTHTGIWWCRECMG